MHSKKLTLSTLALALSVVLASCSGGAGTGGNGGTYNPNNSGSSVNGGAVNNNNNANTNANTNSDSIEYPPAHPLPTSFENLSFTYNPPKNIIYDLNTSLPYVVSDIRDFTSQTDATFNGVKGYDNIAAAWDISATTGSQASIVLSKYGMGLGRVFGSDDAGFVPTVITTSSVKTSGDTAKASSHVQIATAGQFNGQGQSVAIVGNAYQVVGDQAKNFQAKVTTVDLDTSVTPAETANTYKSLGFNPLNSNAYYLGASITGKRDAATNGLVNATDLYVSTVGVNSLDDGNLPADLYLNLYKKAHPTVIVSDQFSVVDNLDSFILNAETVASKTVDAIKKVTTDDKITDKPLFIFSAGDYGYNKYVSSYNLKSIDNTHTKVNLDVYSSSNVLRQVFEDKDVVENSIVVGGVYFDPKGIFTEHKQAFKAKALDKADVSATSADFNRDQAVTKAASTFNGQNVFKYDDLYYDSYTKDKRSSFVIGFGSFNCDVSETNCLLAPLDYTADLVSRANETGQSLDQAFPATDPRFQHTLFSSKYAAGKVAAAAVMVKQQFPWYSAKNLKVTLLTTATPLSKFGVEDSTGWGVLNVDNALGGPQQFAFGDFVANLKNQSYAAYKAQQAQDKANGTNTTTYYTSYFTHNISGDGGLYVYGDDQDTLILTGNNTYKGDTYVLGGKLVVDGSKLVVDGSKNANKYAALNNSKVFVAPQGTFSAINAYVNKQINSDGVVNLTSSIVRGLTGSGNFNLENTTVDPYGTDFASASKSTDITSSDNPQIINITGNYSSNVSISNSTVNGNIFGTAKNINLTNVNVTGSISSGDTDSLYNNYGGRKNKFTNVNLKNTTVYYDLNVSGNATIIDSTINSGLDRVTTTLNADSQISNSTFTNLNLGKNSTFYFDPSAKSSTVKNSLNLFGTVAVAPKDKRANPNYVVSASGNEIPIFYAYSLTGNFSNEEAKSDNPLLNYTVKTISVDADTSGNYPEDANHNDYRYKVVATVKAVAAASASAKVASGFSVVDKDVITSSSALVDGLVNSGSQAYTNHNRGLALSSSAANTLTLASDLQSFNADQLRTFLVKASAPIYSDLITANSVTLSDAYLDFSRKVNANYFSSLDNRKVKAYVSYSFLNNKFDTEFDQNSNANTNSVAGAHSYSTNLKATQLSNSVSAGAYGQFGYYNVGIGANYLHNDWKEKYADYEQVVANQQDLLMNLGQAKVDTATLMLSLAKTTGNYFLGTSIFGSYQRYNVDRSSLATLDQNAKFNSYGVTVNFNTGFRHFISTNSGFSGQAGIAYNYNYHDKFSEQANSDLAKVLSYDIKAQGTSLAYANFLGQYFYNFNGFGFNQRLNLELGYTLNLFSTANQQITNSVTGVSLSSSNAFTGSNANLLKFAAGYRVSLIKDLDLDLGVSYYTNNYWRVVKGTATLTYSF